MNQIIADEKDINDEIFWNYLKYQNSLLLAKDLIRVKQSKNQQLINNINDDWIDLRKAIIRTKTPGNEYRNKIELLLKDSSTLINNKKVKELKYWLLKKLFKDC